MKVNKNSWHYKLMDYWDYKIIDQLLYGNNVTLCKYFWNTIGAILQSVGFVLMICTAIALLSLCFFGIIVAPINYLLTAYFGVPELCEGLGVVTIFLFWVILPIIAGFEEYMRGNIKGIPDWMRSTPKEEVVVTKSPNLVWEYLKAKKAKVCPLIQLEK